MRAVVCTGYGPPEVLKLTELPKPSPKDNEVLIRNYATTCHIGDTRIRSFNVPFWQMIPFRIYLGILRPKHPVLGMELAGVVEAVGKQVTRFKPGDEVMAFTGFGFGAYAEYACVLADSPKIDKGMIVPKPVNMTFAEAAAGVTSGGVTALSGLRNGDIGSGKKVMVYGASGSVGTFAVQLAKHFGAEVTGICSTANLELVKSLGADNIIDYTMDDLTKFGSNYDLVFDAVLKMKPGDGKKLLKSGGVFTKAGSNSHVTLNDFYFLKDLVEKGELRTVIDRTYTLDQIVEAHHYVEKGHKKGHVVVSIIPGDKTS